MILEINPTKKALVQNVKLGFFQQPYKEYKEKENTKIYNLEIAFIEFYMIRLSILMPK